MKRQELRAFLDAKVEQYNTHAFLECDPISIPHRFHLREDIEISGFLTAIISWGNRKSIIRSAAVMMELMDHAPHEFLMGHSEKDLKALHTFVHRTFNGADLAGFIKGLKHVYQNYGGPEAIFLQYATSVSLQPAITAFKHIFLEADHDPRSRKHLSDPERGSAAKRINMYLRWMVRKDNKGVDFGLWNRIPAGILSCPLDVHSASVARKLGILQRRQNDAKAVAELDKALRRFNQEDPVRYDYALFGLGVFEKF